MARRGQKRRSRGRRGIGCVGVALALFLVGAAGGAWLVSTRPSLPATSLTGRCVATANEQSVSVTLEQAHYASIISAISVQRGLPPRAATIALATAYQESGIRNLDYGDRDSLGLFQQRPSQGWGTVEEITDPVHATNAFYDALVKIDDWQNGDINDTAQAVQRSGYPEAYRKHEPDARILASVLTGHSPGGLTCTAKDPERGGPHKTIDALQTAFGPLPLEEVDADGTRALTFHSDTDATQWAVAHFAIANANQLGITQVQVGSRVWTASDSEQWADAEGPAGVTIRF